MVVKMRGGKHSKDIREYEITSDGLHVGDRLTGFHGLITGVPKPITPEGGDGEGAVAAPTYRE
jgi:circadian clock protein KaiC